MPRKKQVKLYTLDTETIGLAGSIRRIAIFDGEQVHYGYTFKDIEPVILKDAKKYDVHIYVHNLDFDARKMPEVIKKGNVDWGKCLVINRRYSTLACKKYTFHDSFMLLPMSLAKASKAFDLKHGKLDLWDAVQKTYPGQYKDHVDFLSRCDVDDHLYLEYLGYDVKALYELIQKLIQVSTIPIEKLVRCASTASMSKYLLKNGYNGQIFITENRSKTDFEFLVKNKYWLSQKPMKDNPGVTWQEIEYKIREAYFGGRTEVFTPVLYEDKTHCIRAFHYDVNSLYPFVCLVNYFPVGVPHFYNNPAMIKYKFNLWCKYHRGLGFIKCKVFVPKQKIPPLPCRVEKLVFMCGYLSGTWTYNELEYAVKNCGVQILEFDEMIHFSETFKVYENFIKVFSDIKEQATKDKNEALRTFTKLIMNTAYGWTGMKRDDKTKLDDISKKDKYDDKGLLLRTDEVLGFCESKEIVRAETIQVQIAAYVTSYARLVLLDALRKQADKGEVYYCDTDSIVCEKEMDENMIDNVAIGKWGLENVLKKGLFLQPKVYAEVTADETNLKFKGVTKKRQSELDFSFYEDIYNRLASDVGGRLEVETGIERLPSLVTAQKRGIDPNTVTITSKTLNLDNTQKRRMNYKENYSEAWYMDSFTMFENFTFQENISFEGVDFFEKRR